MTGADFTLVTAGFNVLCIVASWLWPGSRKGKRHYRTDLLLCGYAAAWSLVSAVTWGFFGHVRWEVWALCLASFTVSAAEITRIWRNRARNQ